MPFNKNQYCNKSNISKHPGSGGIRENSLVQPSYYLWKDGERDRRDAQKGPGFPSHPKSYRTYYSTKINTYVYGIVNYYYEFFFTLCFL